MIKVSQQEKGILVSIPYSLKDAFKETFKTAKWQPNLKAWLIGPSSKKRLEGWISAMEGAVDKAEEEAKLHDELPLREDEIKALRERARKIEADLKDLHEEHERLEDLKKAISSMRPDLEAKLQEKKSLEETNKRLRGESREALAGLIDFAEVEKAVLEMKAMRRFGAGTANRLRFEGAQEVLEKARKALSEKGLRSRGLDFLCGMRFNRPDADRFSDAPDILDINRKEDE